MAWMEGKLQPIDLLSALQMSRQGGGQDDSTYARLMRDEALKQERIKSLLAQNAYEQQTSVPTITVPGVMASGGSMGGAYKVPITDLPGQVSGQAAPTYGQQVHEGNMQTGRLMADMAQTAARANAGVGGGGPSQPEQDIMSEKARAMRYERQGYTGTGSDLLARQKMESDMQLAKSMNDRVIERQALANQGAIATAGVRNEGGKTQAEINAAGRVKAAEVTAGGKGDTKGMIAERSELYKQAANYALTPEQLSTIESDFPKLYELSKKNNQPIPWSKIFNDILKGTYQL